MNNPWETPYLDAEEAYFSFCYAKKAQAEGVTRFVGGAGRYCRPSQPVDIETVITRLYATQKLTADHIAVLKHYGRRFVPPDPRREKEARSAIVWKEALSIIGTELKKKGIVHVPIPDEIPTN